MRLFGAIAVLLTVFAVANAAETGEGVPMRLLSPNAEHLAPVQWSGAQVQEASSTEIEVQKDDATQNENAAQPEPEPEQFIELESGLKVAMPKRPKPNIKMREVSDVRPAYTLVPDQNATQQSAQPAEQTPAPVILDGLEHVPSASQAQVAVVQAQERSAGQKSEPVLAVSIIEQMALQGQEEEALRRVQQRLNRFPQDAKAVYLKGLILLQLDRKGEAEPWFKMMKANFPHVPQSYNALALLAAARGDAVTAQKELEQALQIAPEYATARHNLAELFVARAQQEYLYLLKENPQNHALQKKLDALQQLSPSSLLKIAAE